MKNAFLLIGLIALFSNAYGQILLEYPETRKTDEIDIYLSW